MTPGEVVHKMHKGAEFKVSLTWVSEKRQSLIHFIWNIVEEIIDIVFFIVGVKNHWNVD